MSTALNDFRVYLHHTKMQIDSCLDEFLPSADDDSTNLYQAIRYSVLNNGKRLRPALVYAVGETLGIAQEKLHGVAMSIELIHCYSLIHDDLPAMDNDDLRRGIPTCHKAFDEATAMLAGDGLQALAFEVLTDPKWTPFSNAVQLHMIKILSRASGIFGMVLGQAKDLSATQKVLTLEQLLNMHALKTGALFNACITMPLATLHSGLQDNLQRYAYHLGIAFQIQDDILDVIGDQNLLGKPVGSDQKQQKATFTSILGLEGAKEHLSKHMQAAIAALGPLGSRAATLSDLAEFFMARTY